MSEEKKTERVNIENRRTEMFLVAVVLILSCVFTALEWNANVTERMSDDEVEDLLEDIDINSLKKDHDMVAAISHTDNPAEVTNIKPVEMVTDKPLAETENSKLVIGDGKAELPEAKVEEVEPMELETKEEAPEGVKAVEELPEFPGGAGAFMKWITANLKYPKTAQDRKIEGRVVVSFVVDRDGTVKNLRLEKSTDRILGTEVIKTMGRMPKWKPGTQGGKPCKAMIAVPINFDL